MAGGAGGKSRVFLTILNLPSYAFLSRQAYAFSSSEGLWGVIQLVIPIRENILQ